MAGISGRLRRGPVRRRSDDSTAAERTEERENQAGRVFEAEHGGLYRLFMSRGAESSSWDRCKQKSVINIEEDERREV